MADKSDFTAEEWEQILTAPQLAALHVALASPSGPVGVVNEAEVAAPGEIAGALGLAA
jgi:hypothetical protein